MWYRVPSCGLTGNSYLVPEKSSGQGIPRQAQGGRKLDFERKSARGASTPLHKECGPVLATGSCSCLKNGHSISAWGTREVSAGDRELIGMLPTPKAPSPGCCRSVYKPRTMVAPGWPELRGEGGDGGAACQCPVAVSRVQVSWALRKGPASAERGPFPSQKRSVPVVLPRVWAPSSEEA